MMWNRSSDGDAEDRERLAVVAWMKELASLPVTDEPLPDATYLWWKGELLRRWDAQHKVTAPIEAGERVQVGVGLVTAAGLLVWLWRDLPGITPGGTSLTMVMISSAILLAATAAVIVRDLIRGS